MLRYVAFDHALATFENFEEWLCSSSFGNLLHLPLKLSATLVNCSFVKSLNINVYRRRAIGRNENYTRLNVISKLIRYYNVRAKYNSVNEFIIYNRSFEANFVFVNIAWKALNA